jgi:mono/diheme cytochrome c family protein
MYQYQCLSCHNVRGYRSTVSLLGGRDLAGIRSFLALMRETDAKKNPYHGMMPPLVGSDAEVEALAQYLAAMTAAATTTTTAVGSNAPRP